MGQKLLLKPGRNCILVLFKEGGSSVSPKFHLFVPDVNQGNEEAVQVQDFLR